MAEETDDIVVLVKQVKLVIPRLKKITPDSSWARRASGCRGTILRLVERLDDDMCFDRNADSNHLLGFGDDLKSLRTALKRSFEILEGAAAKRLR